MLQDTASQIAELKRQVEELQRAQLQYPLDPRNKRVIHQDIPVMKRKTGSVWTVEVNDIEEDWSFGGGTKSVTLIIGPASNADSAGYDYTTDGTDDDVQIQAAITALASTGGTVVLREGTYTLGATVLINATGIFFKGCGTKTIVTCKNSLNAPMFTIGSGSLSDAITGFSDIYFDGNKANQTSGMCIESDTYGAGKIFVTQCHFYNIKDEALSLWGGGVVSRCYFANIDGNATSRAIKLDGLGNADDMFFSQNMIQGVATTAIIIQASDSSILNNWILVQTGHNNYVISGGSIISGNLIDNASSSISVGASFVGISGGFSTIQGNRIQVGLTPNVASIGITESGGSTITGNIVSGVGIGIVVSGETSCVGNSIVAGYAHGIKIAGSGSIVSSNFIEPSGSITDNTYSGVIFNNSITRCIVTNNRIVGDNGANEYKYCIEETTSCDYNILEHNIAYGAQTGQISVVGANTISANNLTA